MKAYELLSFVFYIVGSMYFFNGTIRAILARLQQ